MPWQTDCVTSVVSGLRPFGRRWSATASARPWSSVTSITGVWRGSSGRVRRWSPLRRARQPVRRLLRRRLLRRDRAAAQGELPMSLPTPGMAARPFRSGPGVDAPAAAAAAGVADRLSEHAEEILQSAARRAGDFGRREVDTEHLLLALTESDVVRTILDQFRSRSMTCATRSSRKAPGAISIRRKAARSASRPV